MPIRRLKGFGYTRALEGVTDSLFRLPVASYFTVTVARIWGWMEQIYL
jgi:hypothetical protein